MGDGFINRENMFQLLRTSLISQAGEEDAEESVRVGFLIVHFSFDYITSIRMNSFYTLRYGFLFHI